jgi:AAHS family 4-hydroxybenzoate transporter-like MFS transporter
VVGGLASSVLIPKFGWTSVFWVGGIVPVILIPIVVIALPESVRFLAKRVDKSALETVLRRLKIDASIAPAITAAPDEPRAPLPSLFTQGRAVGTIMLWVILLLSLLMTYFLINWIPIIATQNGLPARVAIIGAVMLNLGSILGSIVLGRFVRKRPATTIVVGYVLGAIAIVGIGQAAHSSAGSSRLGCARRSIPRRCGRRASDSQWASHDSGRSSGRWSVESSSPAGCRPPSSS